MEQWFDQNRLAGLGQQAIAWIRDEVLLVENLVQLVVILVALGVAALIHRGVAGWLDRRAVTRPPGMFLRTLRPLLLAVIWLALQWLAIGIAGSIGYSNYLLEITASLLTAWVIIRLVSQTVRDPVWSRLIAWTAWTIAALNILNLLDPTIAMLDSAALTFGDFRVSIYTVVKSTLALAFLLTIAVYASQALEARIRTTQALSPSLQVLLGKSFRVVLITLAILIAIRSVGIDLTALAVFSGAVGLGLGFGLQKVIGNLVSGVILLVDRSIKPGDVILVGETYGWVTALGGRYVSVVTRDGTEHLIPNETLITERVENWTHSDNQHRLKIPVGIHYKSDVRKAMEICLEAAQTTERVLKDPEPAVLLREFGDSSVDLEIRFWIDDVQNGTANVSSAVLLKVWDGFHAHDIEIPYPQRDLHIRTPRDIDEVVDRLTAGRPVMAGGQAV